MLLQFAVGYNLYYYFTDAEARTERGYLEEGLSVTKMHELYNKAAEEGETVSLYIYDQVSNRRW